LGRKKTRDNKSENKIRITCEADVSSGHNYIP
jgi:hypothetical protein